MVSLQKQMAQLLYVPVPSSPSCFILGNGADPKLRGGVLPVAGEAQHLEVGQAAEGGGDGAVQLQLGRRPQHPLGRDALPPGGQLDACAEGQWCFRTNQKSINQQETCSETGDVPLLPDQERTKGTSWGLES